MAMETDFNEEWDLDFSEPPVPGTYHVGIVDINEDGGRKGSMIVVFEVVAAKDPDMVGRQFTDYFYKSPKAVKRIHQLFIACGMITKDQLKAMFDAGQRPAYEVGQAVARQLMIRLEEEEYEGKVRSRLGFDIFHPEDGRAKNYPKNLELLKEAGFDVSKMVSAEAKTEPAQGMFDGLFT